MWFNFIEAQPNPIQRNTFEKSKTIEAKLSFHTFEKSVYDLKMEWNGKREEIKRERSIQTITTKKNNNAGIIQFINLI